MKQSFTEVTFTLQLGELYTCPTLLGSLKKKKRLWFGLKFSGIQVVDMSFFQITFGLTL